MRNVQLLGWFNFRRRICVVGEKRSLWSCPESRQKIIDTKKQNAIILKNARELPQTIQCGMRTLTLTQFQSNPIESLTLSCNGQFLLKDNSNEMVYSVVALDHRFVICFVVVVCLLNELNLYYHLIYEPNNVDLLHGSLQIKKN